MLSCSLALMLCCSLALVLLVCLLRCSRALLRSCSHAGLLSCDFALMLSCCHALILRYRACRPQMLSAGSKSASVIKSPAGQKREKGKPEASSMDDGCPEHAFTRSRANNLPAGGVLMSGDPYEKRVDLMVGVYPESSPARAKSLLGVILNMRKGFTRGTSHLG